MLSARTRICPVCNAQTVGGSQCEGDGARLVDDLSGVLIDERFLLKAPIGAGGMGSAVWYAQQTSTGRDVALKMLKPGDAEAEARFRRGAVISSHLNHPNITTTHAVGRHSDGSLFLVMEHLDGVGLRQAMRAGPMAVDRVVALVDQLLSALSHMSERGFAHLDIKPDNLFLVGRHDVRLKVLDFDIADVIDDGVGARLESVLTPRGVSRICGTPQYMAPEVLLGRRADHRADLYAVGVLMFQLLTGQLPYVSTAPEALIREHRRGTPRLALVRPLSGRLAALILRALRPNPKLRFDDASSMRRALRDAERSTGSLVPIGPRADAPTSRLGEASGATTGSAGSKTVPGRPSMVMLR